MRSDPKSSESSKGDYVERTNCALDYIVRNLDGDLRLETVAGKAHFSPFHFHRIFQSLLGETLNQFVKRQRLERALYLMAHSPSQSLTDIALACGFSSSSDFSRNFKKRYGLPPSVLDINSFRDSRRAEYEATIAAQENGPKLSRLPEGTNPDGFEVVLRDLPPRTVAYIRVLNPFQPPGLPDACKRLVQWAEDRGLAGGQWLGYMWEDPELVAMADCRYDVAVVVDDVVPEGEVGRFEFPAMRVAEVHLKGDIELEQRALDWLSGTWLPRSGYEPADQPAFEAWVGLPFAHGYEHFELSCQLAVKRC